MNDVYVSPMQATSNTLEELGFLPGSIIPIGLFTPVSGTTGTQGILSTSDFRSKWMEKSLRFIGNKKIYELIIPGGCMSHSDNI